MHDGNPQDVQGPYEKVHEAQQCHDGHEGANPDGFCANSTSTLFGYVAPEMRLGLRLGDHVELSAGVEALVLVPLSRPSWPADHPVNAGIDGIGTFPFERLLGFAVFAVTPGLGLRYDF